MSLELVKEGLKRDERGRQGWPTSPWGRFYFKSLKDF